MWCGGKVWHSTVVVERGKVSFRHGKAWSRYVTVLSGMVW